MKSKHARVGVLVVIWGLAFGLLSANEINRPAAMAPNRLVIQDSGALRNLTATIPVSGFIFPILGASVSDPLQNVRDPREDGWHVNNGFGNYCPRCLGSQVYVYHPGEDFNIDTCPTCDANLPVYAVQDGLVIRSHKMSNSLGWAVIIKHELDSEIDISSYYLPNTSSNQTRTTVVSSAYLHLNKPSFGNDGELDVRRGDTPVTINKGDPVGTIYPYTSGGPHLHLEIRSNDDAATADPNKSSGGYYTSLQDITNFGNINASAFLRDHTGSPSCRNGSSEQLRINGGPPTHPDGTIVKTNIDPAVYVLRAGQKRLIPSEAILATLYQQPNGGFTFEDVVTIAADEMNGYPVGAVISSSLPSNGRGQPDGRLIRDTTGQQVSIVSNGQRRPFTSANIFQQLGYRFCRVIAVGDYTSYTEGPAISDALPSTTPTASFTMTGCGKSAGNNQTLSCSAAPGASVSVDFDSVSSQPGAGNTIRSWQWKVDGAVVGTLSRLTRSLGAGNHTVMLDVGNSAGIHDSTSGTVVVTESSAAAPVINFISPTSAAQGIIDLTINGSNFDANAIDQIYFGNNFVGNGQITGRTGSTQIKVRESMSTATLGTYTVKVKNSDGQLSNGVPLTLTQNQTPAPVLNSINPPLVSPSVFDLTISGDKFDSGAIDQIYFGNNLVGNGTILSRNPPNQIVVRESMATAMPGNYTVKVKNSDGQLSNGLLLSLTQTPPTISNMTTSPSPPVGGPAFNFIITGTNFNTSNAEVFFLGPGCSTSSACVVSSLTRSATQLSGAAVLASGSFTAQVRNGSGGPPSNTWPFTVSSGLPTPTITNMTTSPNPAVGAQPFNFTITGTNYDASSAEVFFLGPGCSTSTSCVVSGLTRTSTQLSGAAILAAGSFTAQVRNGSGGTPSNTWPLTVSGTATPTISNITTSPSPPNEGQAFNFMVTGTNYNTSNAEVFFLGPGCPTGTSCVVSGLTRTATQLSGAAILAAGSFAVQVRNGPSGTPSNTWPLIVSSTAPSITNISPTSVGAGVFDETINGSNFDPATVEVVTNGPSCAPCTVPNGALTTKTSTQVVAPVTLGNTGSFTFQVRNGSSGTLSNSKQLTVNSVLIDNISPPNHATGSFDLTINGGGFNPESVLVVINGPSCSPCTVPNNALTTKTTIQVVAPVTLNNAGTFTVQVRNGAAGPLSNSKTLTITANPSITNISPTSVGAGVFNETINGSNFDPATVEVVINGPSCAPCTVPNGALTTKTSTQVVTPVTLGNTGSFTFQVRNGSAGTLSNSKTLTVNSVVINNISPTSRATGSFNLTINGSGFNPESVLVVVTGPGCSPCSVPNNVLSTKTTTQVVAPVTLNNAGSFTIQVRNGAAGPLSSSATLTITATPSISNISPTSVGAGVFNETINGSNFDPSTVEVVINGPSCAPCTVPNGVLTTKTSSQVVAPVTLGNTGSFTFQVRNGLSGTLSNSQSLTVNSVVINNISPTSRATGSFNLTINGSGFNPESVLVVVTGPGCSPCSVPNNVLSTKTTTQVVAPLTLNTAGTYTIQVRNGSPGPLSNGNTLTIF